MREELAPSADETVTPVTLGPQQCASQPPTNKLKLQLEYHFDGSARSKTHIKDGETTRVMPSE